MNCMQLGAKSLLTGMATRQHTYAMPKRGLKRLAARFRNASSEQSDARERRTRAGLKWTAFRRRPVIGNVRQLLQHVLPRGFVRIRSFGFLANRHRAERLALIRRLLGLGQAASKPLAGVQPTEARGHRMVQTGRPNLSDRIAATYRHLRLDST